MVSHHPAKFNGHRHCDSEDINSPENVINLSQMRDCNACLLTPAILIYFKAHDLSSSGTQSIRLMKHLLRVHFPVSVMKFFQVWTHATWVTIHET